MTISASQVQNVTNYLVPSSGQTHAVEFNGVFSASPALIDWRQFSIDQFPFQPQGVFVDNTQGAGPLTITILPLGYNIKVPAGIVAQAQFPAPNGQTAQITGDGQASVIFVDFPVLPSGGSTNVLNTVSVNVVSPDPLPVLAGANSAGIPYQNTEVPAVVTPYYASIAAAAVSATITPSTANLYLRKVMLNLTENATLATAGNNLLTLTLNGTVIYKNNIYIPATAVGGLGGFEAVLDFAKLGLPAGPGSLVVTLGTALTKGILDINAYFG